MTSYRTRLLVTVAALTIGAAPVRAERVHDLSRTLINSTQDKERIAAAVALGRLGDVRAIKPLVAALRDGNRMVRAVAAMALGHLADDMALPALQRATTDSDELVRKRAVEAIAAIRNRTAAAAPALAANRAGFGSAPARVGPEPRLFIAVKSTLDESKAPITMKERTGHGDKVRSWVLAELGRQPDVTVSEGEARSLGLGKNTIDVSIVKLDLQQRGSFMEVECQIRVAISDDRGKMLSFLTGGAKVQVPRSTFQARYLPQLRLEAIENAVKSVHQDMLTYLRRTRAAPTPS
ncbi:MAG TPA: HEAT repeat domain-containing protein [Kofleriaceae bacterium]|nr:HEAT repeat domain-containing protein [Kofleriaceae bacterium]